MKGVQINLEITKRGKYYFDEVVCSCGNNEHLRWRVENGFTIFEVITWACSKCGRLHKEQVYETGDGKKNIINYEVLDRRLNSKQLAALRLKAGSEEAA